MASAAGLTQRRRNYIASDNSTIDGEDPGLAVSRRSSTATSPTNTSGNLPNGNVNGFGRVVDARDPTDDDEEDGDGKGPKGSKLTILEEVLLLGLKDVQVLRGCILIELSVRNRIATVKEIRKRPYAERLVEVVDERPTGEVLLDEALRLIKLEKQSVGNWIDLMSGETWNLMKIGYQLKQVRERIAKGLVDKGVLRTEKRNFVLFDMATHPVADHTAKEQLIQRVVDTLLGRGPPPDRRTIAMVCAAYAANVLENALVGLSHSQREAAFQKVDELLQEHSTLTDKAKASGTTEIMAGVLTVYTKVRRIFASEKQVLSFACCPSSVHRGSTAEEIRSFPSF
ncbi:hypothetical protein HK102_001504 [Quaeritorhiza haematococci]|nr:hypothetical protein HK102_001504 [Quaeritorhiza haematococci]